MSPLKLFAISKILYVYIFLDKRSEFSPEDLWTSYLRKKHKYDSCGYFLNQKVYLATSHVVLLTKNKFVLVPEQFPTNENFIAIGYASELFRALVFIFVINILKHIRTKEIVNKAILILS